MTPHPWLPDPPCCQTRRLVEPFLRVSCRAKSLIPRDSYQVPKCIERNNAQQERNDWPRHEHRHSRNEREQPNKTSRQECQAADRETHHTRYQVIYYSVNIKPNGRLRPCGGDDLLPGTEECF